jgi:hypothetical protein
MAISELEAFADSEVQRVLWPRWQTRADRLSIAPILAELM